MNKLRRVSILRNGYVRLRALSFLICLSSHTTKLHSPQAFAEAAILLLASAKHSPQASSKASMLCRLVVGRSTRKPMSSTCVALAKHQCRTCSQARARPNVKLRALSASSLTDAASSLSSASSFRTTATALWQRLLISDLH